MFFKVRIIYLAGIVFLNSISLNLYGEKRPLLKSSVRVVRGRKKRNWEEKFLPFVEGFKVPDKKEKTAEKSLSENSEKKNIPEVRKAPAKKRSLKKSEDGKKEVANIADAEKKVEKNIIETETDKDEKKVAIEEPDIERRPLEKKKGKEKITKKEVFPVEKVEEKNIKKEDEAEKKRERLKKLRKKRKRGGHQDRKVDF